MSGPKDYTFVFRAERLAQIRLQQQVARQSRAAAVRDELARAAQRAAEARASQGANRMAAIRAKLAQQIATRREELEHAVATAMASTIPDSAPESRNVDPAVAAAQAEAQRLDAEAEVDANQQTPDEKAAALQGWAIALARDPAVATFVSADLSDWTRRSVELAQTLPEDFATRADVLAGEAQTILDRAGDIQARFDTRNALLHDVIESMKEMGYFVSDPYFANPADPTGPAVLKATCGSELITTSVDLSSTVHSVWDGQEREHCKASFFDYMDAMHARGVTLTPEREDLRERPILKQHGANQLPRSNDTSRKAGA